jgi:hypothetical protein
MPCPSLPSTAGGPAYTSRVARRQGFPAAILLCAWVLLYAPLLAGHRTFPARDIGATQLPWRAVWRAQVSAGVIPLWDPNSSGGRPMLANPNAMAAYPGTLLFLLLPLETAVTWHLAIHHLLLLLGCYRLARRSGASHAAAAAGAAVVGSCGVVWSSLTFLNFQASLTWVAWALGTAVPPPTTGIGAARRALGGGALLGLAFLGGEPAAVILGAVAWFSLALSLWPRRLRAISAVATAAAIGVAAPVLVPLLATYPDTVRGRLGLPPGAFAADALAPRRYLELLFPNLLGPALATPAQGFWAAASFPWQRYYPLVFVGGLVLVTLPFARGRARRLAPWWTLAGVGFGAALLLGLTPVWALAARIAALGVFRYTVKFLVLPILALPVLVAHGWEELAERWRRRGRKWCLALTVIAMAALPLVLATRTFLRPLLTAAYPASTPALGKLPAAELRHSALRDWFALVVPPAALAAAGPVAEVAVVATLAGGAVGGSSLVLTDSAAAWARPPAALGALPRGATIAAFAKTGVPPREPAAPELEIYWDARAALAPQYGTRWGLSYVLTRGPDGLEPYRGELLAAAVSHLPIAERAAVAEALGAQAVVAGAPVPAWNAAKADGVWVSLAPHPAPRAYLARRAVAAQGPVATAQALASPAFHSGSDVVLEGTFGARSFAAGDLHERSGTPFHRRFEASLEGPGLLVVQQSFMHGWRAMVDGIYVRVEPANGANLAAPLPRGRHDVDVLLDPAPYLLGAAGPPFVLLAALLIMWAGASRARAGARRGSGRTTPATPPEPPP